MKSARLERPDRKGVREMKAQSVLQERPEPLVQPEQPERPEPLVQPEPPDLPELQDQQV